MCFSRFNSYPCLLLRANRSQKRSLLVNPIGHPELGGKGGRRSNNWHPYKQAGPLWKASPLELGSMSSGSLAGRGVWGRTDTCVYVVEPLFVHLKLSHNIVTWQNSNIKLKTNFFFKWPLENVQVVSENYTQGTPWPPSGEDSMLSRQGCGLDPQLGN